LDVAPLRDRFGIAEVVLLTLGIWPHVLRRHQPGIVAKGFELPNTPEEPQRLGRWCEPRADSGSVHQMAREQRSASILSVTVAVIAESNLTFLSEIIGTRA
jgi:hypothetical protein